MGFLAFASLRGLYIQDNINISEPVSVIPLKEILCVFLIYWILYWNIIEINT